MVSFVLPAAMYIFHCPPPQATQKTVRDTAGAACVLVVGLIEVMEIEHSLSKYCAVYQILCGRDVAIPTNENNSVYRFARQMANFAYVVVCRKTGDAVVFDAAWDVASIVNVAKQKCGAKRIVTAVYTHRHFDHAGGILPRYMTGGRVVRLDGIAEILEEKDVQAVYIGAADLAAVLRQSELNSDAVRALNDGDTLPPETAESAMPECC
eukprot:g3339.t1